MIIIEDSRQKIDKNKHIKDQMEQLGHKVIRSKLLVGDYQIANKGDVVIDTKYSLNEVESNLIHDHDRFRNECVLAQEAGIRLIILVQESNISSLPNVCSWYNFRRRTNPKAINGKTLYKIMLTMQEKYGVEWQFCKKHECGKRIVEILTEVK